MTLKQIEKIRETIKELEILKDSPTPEEIDKIDSNLINYFQKQYNSPTLNSYIHIQNGTETSTEEMLTDIDNICAVLKGMLDSEYNYSEVEKILDLIEEGKKLPNNNSAKQKFISEVYYTYNDAIKFDSSIENIARLSVRDKTSWDEVLHTNGNYYKINSEVIQGILNKLSIHAEDILSKKHQSNQHSNPSTVILNENHNSSVADAENTNIIDISVIFINARQKVGDAGLSDEQHKAVMEKLDELESIAKSKESKGKKWAKAKGIMKWLVEQGIQVAGIVLPVLAATIG